jgi:hypothetical protein
MFSILFHRGKMYPAQTGSRAGSFCRPCPDLGSLALQAKSKAAATTSLERVCGAPNLIIQG